MMANRSMVLNPGLRRAYHSVARSGATATEGQTPVVVYDSAEFAGLSGASSSSGGSLASWDGLVMAGPHRAKFFSLLPFQIESRFTAKSFVLRMELFPEARYLKLHTLKMNGVQ